MTEPTEVTPNPVAPPAPQPEAAAAKPAAARPAAKAAEAGPVRPLPTQEDIAEWIHGGDVPLVAALFEGLTLQRFDALVMQVRKEELVPQHWQVISDHTPPGDVEFNRLAEVGRLRVRNKDQELSRRRLAQLIVGWRELGGRRPALWTVPDLLAAMRRIIAQGRPVEWYDFLTAIRDVWRDLELPSGREQLEVLWACLAQIRKSTKK
jgi:hypothetical protein